jgi:hypothetical protein
MSEFITKEEFEARLIDLKHEAVEEALRVLPSVLQNLVVQVAHVKELRDNFYRDHPELDSHKEIVAKVVEEVEASNPGLIYDKLMEKVAPIARQRIKALSIVDSNNGKPSLEKLDHLANMFEG